jgi:hypothetical protein
MPGIEAPHGVGILTAEEAIDRMSNGAGVGEGRRQRRNMEHLPGPAQAPTKMNAHQQRNRYGSERGKDRQPRAKN